jgi:tetratricopeptide (TPR) repeat protein
MPSLVRASVCLAVIVLLAGITYGQSSVAELNEAGWKALEEDNSRRAASLFAEALAIRPDDPVLLLGAGAAAHENGKERDAKTHLQRALEVDPTLTPASLLLGRIAFDAGDVDLALQTYERALKHAPGDPVLLETVEAWRRETETHRTFEERRHGRFRVLFEGRADESLASDATAIMDSAFWHIGEKLGSYATDTIVAVLYTEQQFRDITRAPEWSGGQYDGRIRLPAAGAAQKPEAFKEVLVHELAHAVIAGIVPRGVPAWLDEGLAQYFDGSDPEAARRRLARLSKPIPLTMLEEGFGRLDAVAAQVAYDESLLAVSVMMDRPAFGWHRLLSRLAGGETFSDTIENFGFSYADLEAPFTR